MQLSIRSAFTGQPHPKFDFSLFCYPSSMTWVEQSHVCLMMIVITTCLLVLPWENKSWQNLNQNSLSMCYTKFFRNIVYCIEEVA